MTSQGFAVVSYYWMGFSYSVSLGSITKVDKKTSTVGPQLKSIQMPDYPVVDAGISRDVIVSFRVTESGSVDEIDVIEVGQTIPDIFAAAVKSAVSKWTFHPGISRTSPRKAVPVRMKCRFKFRIKEDSSEVEEPKK